MALGEICWGLGFPKCHFWQISHFLFTICFAKSPQSIFGLTNSNRIKWKVVKCAIRDRESYLQDKPVANLCILSALACCDLDFQMLWLWRSYSVSPEYFLCHLIGLRVGVLGGDLGGNDRPS